MSKIRNNFFYVSFLSSSLLSYKNKFPEPCLIASNAAEPAVGITDQII